MAKRPCWSSIWVKDLSVGALPCLPADAEASYSRHNYINVSQSITNLCKGFSYNSFVTVYITFLNCDSSEGEMIPRSWK
ncbi:hypothetical protein F4779DRAFT_562321 [Xylariaceae sp. FL0662B]|nr:hypothetical protein F4779DRAFT_562321 [Xylariaceae sp. FL0662B]